MCKLYIKLFVIKIEHEIFQLSFSTWTMNILRKHLWGTYKVPLQMKMAVFVYFMKWALKWPIPLADFYLTSGRFF